VAQHPLGHNTPAEAEIARRTPQPSLAALANLSGRNQISDAEFTTRITMRPTEARVTLLEAFAFQTLAL
jgi:hypothetical protein